MALNNLCAYLAAKNRGENPSYTKWWPGVPHLVAFLRKRREREEAAQQAQQEQAKRSISCASVD